MYLSSSAADDFFPLLAREAGLDEDFLEEASFLEEPDLGAALTAALALCLALLVVTFFAAILGFFYIFAAGFLARALAFDGLAGAAFLVAVWAFFAIQFLVKDMQVNK